MREEAIKQVFDQLNLPRDGKITQDDWRDKGYELFLAAGSDTAGEAAMHAKFSEGDYDLRYNNIATFFGGLDKEIGPPSAKTETAMTREHVHERDSEDFFETSNYKIRTKPTWEWQFVVDPDSPPHDLPAGEWPRESEEKIPKTGEPGADKFRRRRPLRIGLFEKDPSDGKPHPIDDVITKGRDGMAGLDEINSKLEVLHEKRLLRVELIGGRLYTGPMVNPSPASARTLHATHSLTLPPQFMKYNAVLRRLPKSAYGYDVLKGCRGNGYVTTIHVSLRICSSIT